MNGIWKYAADIIQRAGATTLTLYALILLCGFVLIHGATKRASPKIAVASGFGWLVVATGLLALFVQPGSAASDATRADVPNEKPSSSHISGDEAPPPAIALNASGQAPITGHAFALDLGDIPGGADYQVNLTAMSETVIPNVSLRSADDAVLAMWDFDLGAVQLDPTDPSSLQITIKPNAVAASPARYDVYLETGDKILAKIIISLRVVPLKHVTGELSGVSGIGERTGPSYNVCLKPPGRNFLLIEKSVKGFLSGDRSCDAWSSCQVTTADNRSCLAFAMQGHSEFHPDTPHTSTGHIEADYAIATRSPRLTAADVPKTGPAK